jgi:signal transduction histidine kinase/tetratricopeptide (TPR) repeat protein
VKIKLNWHKRAVILFATAILVIGVFLTIFAIREAEREKLVKENEIEEQQRRFSEFIISQVKIFISETEERILRQLSRPSIANFDETVNEVSGQIKETEDIVEEIFYVDSGGHINFPLLRPLFLATEEYKKQTVSPPSIENNPLFKTAEEAEFKTKNYSLAINSYGRLMNTFSHGALRAILLNRIARCYLKTGNSKKATETYQRLLKSHPNEFSGDGTPLGIIALHQMGTIYATAGNKLRSFEAYLELFTGLLEARWPLTKPQFLFYNKRVKDELRKPEGEMGETEKGTSLLKRWQELQTLEEAKLSRMNSVEVLTQRIIPLLEIDEPSSTTFPKSFSHVSEIIGGENYLIAFTPLEDGSIFGMRFDSEILADKLSPAIVEQIPGGGSEDWKLQIADEAGNILAGEEIIHQESQIYNVTYSTYFEDGFPPWRINLFQKQQSSTFSQFRTRRNIYILSVVIAMAALLLGGGLAIRSTAKELKLARLKSDFVSTVSHEFRTPLTSIRYLAELLQRGRVEEEVKKRQYYDTISHESERLSRLIENILDFSKIEAGMKEYEFEKTDVAALAQEVVSRFQEQTAPKGFVVESEIPDSVPHITADKEALSRAILNLLDNAVKYSGDNRKVVFRARSDEDHIYLDVEDQGVGISTKDQERVFEKFFRAGNMPDSSVKGSGIGLTIVAHIVKAHQGEVVLESEEGKGTTVTIQIPVKSNL